MVGAAFILQLFQAGLFHNAFGAYFAVLTQEYGWSKTALSGASALQPMEAAILGPLLGWLMDKFGPRWMIRIGIVIFSLGFVLLSTIDTITGFYGAIFVIAFGASLCGYFPLNVAIIHWFEKKRAKALSYLTMGLAVGGIFVPAVAVAMQYFGWRYTAMASGILVLLIGLPLAGIFRNKPSEYGEHVDGVAPDRSLDKDGNLVNKPQAQFSTKQALRTKAFWLISLGHGSALLFVYAVNVHAISHISQSLGYSITQASLFVTLTTVSQLVGIFIGSHFGDKVEKRFLAAFCMVCHGVGLTLLAFANGPVMLVAFAVIHGVGWGMRGPMMQAMRADYFGSQAIGMILGISSMIIVFGQIAGPMIAATLADLTGNYRAGFLLLAGLVTLASLSFIFATKPELSDFPRGRD